MAVRIAILGLGQRGLQHLAALWKIDDADVVALCDPFPENLGEAKIQGFVDGFAMGDIKTHTKFADLFGAGGFDALYLCMPPNLHRGELVTAARAGVHIFAEKPVTLYYDEAVEMEAACREAGVIATVGFQQRHDHRHEAIRDFLRDKRLVMGTMVGNGTLESHSVKHTRTEELDGPGNRVWAASAAWSGTTVVESGIHKLDLLRYWAGDVGWTRADYVHRDADDVEDGGDNPYAYSVTFGFECGLVFNMMMARLRKTFYGDGYDGLMWDHGHVKIEDGEPVAYYYEGPYPPPPDQRPTPDTLRHVLPGPAARDSTLHINQSFVEAIAHDDPGRLRNTFTSSMNSHAAVLAANVSDQLGGRKIDLAEFATADEYAEFRRKP